MKVVDSFRPGRGRLALLLDCPGGTCVVELKGHRGSPPKEVECPRHPETQVPVAPPPAKPRQTPAARGSSIPNLHREAMVAGAADHAPDSPMDRIFRDAAGALQVAMERARLRARNALMAADKRALHRIAEAAEALLRAPEPVSTSVAATDARNALEKALRAGGYLAEGT